MFETCYLHIGTEKTGSTSIQEFMRLNRETLRQQAFLYPSSLGPLNHRRMRNYAANSHTHLMGAEVREHPGGIAGFRTDVERDLQQEVAATDCQILAVSDEHFHSALTTRDEIGRLRSLLDPWCRTYRVVVYLRRQDMLSRSFHSEHIKVGNSDNEALFPRGITYYYDYRSLIENYESIFGTSSIVVRRYEAPRLVNGDVIDDFAAATGLGDVTSWRRPERRNVALNGLALRFLAELNKHVPQAVGGRPNPDRADLRPLLEAHYAGEGWPVCRRRALEFYQQFAEINEWVRQRFFPDDNSLFEEDFSHYPESDPKDAPSFGDAVSVAGVLWRNQVKSLQAIQSELTRLRAEINARESA